MCRPTIINDEIINTFRDVLAEDSNAIILTDEELCILVNDKLENTSFSYSAFKDWKAFAIETKTKTSDENMVIYAKLRSLIKKALIIQKQELFKKLHDDPTQWQRWAWIIERKFDAWNIRHKTEVDTTVKIDKKSEQRAKSLLDEALCSDTELE